MKVVFSLFVLVGLGIFLAYQFGGIGSFSPADQAAKLKAEVTPGLTWQQVADKRPPRRYRAYIMTDKGFPGLGAEVKFNRAEFEPLVKDGTFSMGFLFMYLFDGEHQYEVNFGPEGKVTSIEKMMTIHDLLPN